MRIPAGASQTIPSFGTGTLGYRSQISGAVGGQTADALFGDSGIMLLEIDDPAPGTNVAPVGVRLIPLIEDLSLEATDGTLLRRSRPALFRGLGRRPRGGDRWGQTSAGSRQPESVGRRPLHPLPARPVPGRRLRDPARPRVQLHLLRPRHRRLRPAGPGLDQPAQALPRRRRQGRHRQHVGPALPLQRGHDDGHGQRRRLLLLRTGDRARRQRAAALRHAAAAARPLQAASAVAAPPAPPPPAPPRPAARRSTSRRRAAGRPAPAPAAALRAPPPTPPPPTPARLPAGLDPAAGDRAGDRAAAAAAGRAAAAAGRGAGARLPGREGRGGGGGDRGVAGLLALRQP